MSAERMMANAMQEQPLFLLPILILLILIRRILAHAAQILFTDLFAARHQQ